LEREKKSPKPKTLNNVGNGEQIFWCVYYEVSLL
jgi:hypothetical protein